MSRCLRLPRRNAQFHVKAMVQERGLSNIRSSNDRDVPGLGCGAHFPPILDKSISAAIRSASRFEYATPSPS